MPQILTDGHCTIMCSALHCQSHQHVEGKGVLATSREAQRRGWRTRARGSRLYWYCPVCARKEREAKP